MNCTHYEALIIRGGRPLNIMIKLSLFFLSSVPLISSDTCCFRVRNSPFVRAPIWHGISVPYTFLTFSMFTCSYYAKCAKFQCNINNVPFLSQISQRRGPMLVSSDLCWVPTIICLCFQSNNNFIASSARYIPFDKEIHHAYSNTYLFLIYTGSKPVTIDSHCRHAI